MNFGLARWPWLFALFLALPSPASLPQHAGVLPPFTKTAALNRLTNQVANRGTNVASYAYTLGAAGNRTGVTELNARAVNYAYDPLYRLTGETVGSDPAGSTGTIGYTFDGVGNRLSRSSTIAAVPAAAHSYTANDWLATDNYDRNGNTIGSGGMPDTYDFENRLVGHGYGLTFVYDGDGNRVQKSVSGTMTTYFVVEDRNPTGYPQVIEELTSAYMSIPVLQRVYTYGHALISQDQLINNQWAMSLYGYDGHGSVRYLTDLQGNVTDAYAYDAFGVLIRATGSTPNLYRYCGEQYDPDLGFYYLRARYSNPKTGRFWNMDSYEGNSEDPRSLHKYLYTQNNPVNMVDPSGHDGDLLSLSATMGTITTLANIVTTSLANYSIGIHLGEKGAMPDAIFFTAGGGGSAKGVTAGISGMFYYDFNQKSLYFLGTIEAGLAPISIFKKQGGFGGVLSVGFAFNAQGPSDFSGLGFSATWPAVMAKTVVPKKLSGWYYFLTAMSARNSMGTQLSKSSGVLQYGYSTSGAAYISFGARYNSFAATVGCTSDPILLGEIPADISLMIQDATKARETPAMAFPAN